MNPNATLTELRRLADIVGLGSRRDGCDDDEQRMAELFESLDEWLSKGGALPDAWRRHWIEAPPFMKGGA